MYSFQQSNFRTVKMLLAMLVLDWLLADTTDATIREYRFLQIPYY